LDSGVYVRYATVYSTSTVCISRRQINYKISYKIKGNIISLFISRIKTQATSATIGGIFPGMNNDVYLVSNQIGDKTGYVTRIFM